MIYFGFVVYSFLLVHAANGPISLLAFPINPAAWFTVAMMAAIAVIAVSGIAYALAGITGSSAMKGWSRSQIYEALLSLALFVIFISFFYIFSTNPTQAFNSVNLMPTNCSTASNPSHQPVNNLYALAACDMSTFNDKAVSAYSNIFWASIVTGLLPSVAISSTIKSPISTSSYIRASPSIGISSALQLFPALVERTVENFVIAILMGLIINQLQIILLSSSLLLFSVFITIGLICRIFGFLRSFGGIMIALALAFGFVYPLLVAITYGYIDVQLQSATLNAVQMTVGLLSIAYKMLLATVTGGTFSPSPLPSSQAMALGGDLILGFSVVPLINFLILDAFVTDLSRVIGERVDFLTLITGII
jgi:hypothetical protein